MRQALIAGFLFFIACKSPEKQKKESIDGFKEISEVQIKGGNLAAEISAYDIDTKKLFVSNNAMGNRIDVIDLNDPLQPKLVDFILLKPWPDEKLTINSVAVKNLKLVVAVSAGNPQDPGMVFVFSTHDFTRLAEIEVGPMPDMVLFSPDGKYILTANEGEPNDTYDVDPMGSVSIIGANDYLESRVDFDGFADQAERLKKSGFRIFGTNASFSQDIEPEYIAISSDSKLAWVTLQENNGIAKIDIENKKLLDIFPLGFKNFDLAGNEIDVCDNDFVNTNTWKIKGMYQPDAIETFHIDGVDYLITANEGDARDYTSFSEVSRVQELKLDSNAFAGAYRINACDSLGRLVVTTTMGDTDGDGDYDELYAFGTRSFSIWDAKSGKLIMDSKNMVEQDVIKHSSFYDDNRSDDKGTEPESVVIGYVNEMPLAFVALERANAIVSYELTNPLKPKFLQVLETGIGPEGVLFIPREDSPNGKSLLIVSSEVDGKIKLYQPQ